MRLCPKCNSKTFNSATICDCGYNFVDNTEPSITCSYCGTVNRANQVFCYSCAYNLHVQHEGARCKSTKNPPKEHTQSNDNTEKQSTESHKDLLFSFDCFVCKEILRVRLPKSTTAYRCPNCRFEFTIQKAQESPPVYMLIPVFRQDSSSKKQPKKTFPPEVVSALAAFGLKGEPAFEDIRQAYKKHLQEYHPDKVSHLGADLRKFAENKTKDLISAYKLLESYYSN